MTMYDHKLVEKKWQDFWEKNKTFEAKVNTSKPKYYVLDMFPYPSGAGLHVGHVTGYTATDVIARFKRAKGFNVLHPMGWDSFGLPAEQYAIRTGTHPKETTKKNIDTYRRQLKSLGFSYDWSREMATSDPEYYKWTQWIFTKLFEKGLAYQAEIMVNFCPELGTVLANEEVEDGKAKEGGYPVERRPLRQWMLKITAYADRLIEDLDDLDWPDYLKRLQTHWIGRSQGLNIQFNIDGIDKALTCFTTRPDTLFGVTFIVISPEHPYALELATESEKDRVSEYCKVSSQKSDLERKSNEKDKTGVFTGRYALDPLTKRKIPIWVADYVMMSYGTGAVMGVSGHDERDFAFASKFDIPIKNVVEPDLKKIEEMYPDEDPNSVKLDIINGQRVWPHGGKLCSSGDFNGLSTHEGYEAIATELERNDNAERCVTYKLRDWLFSRQRYWGEPFPILTYEDGTQRALGLDELPLTPPMLSDFKPTGDIRGPLAKAKEWVQIKDANGKVAFRETNTMPQWAGSCWYYLRFTDPQNSSAAWGQEEEKYWMPVDLYVGGVEHAVLHLLYARFWHKVLYDLKLVSTKEPFASMRNQGLVTAMAYKKEGGGYVEPDKITEKNGAFLTGNQEVVHATVEKMSKSKLNGVNPDDIVDQYGADTLRLYELFMAPFDKEKFWNPEAIQGCHRFLRRVFDLCQSDKIVVEEHSKATQITHKLIKGYTEDMESMLFNTCISKMMEFLNEFTSLDSYPKNGIKTLIQLLHPFSPHIAEECWEILGEKDLSHAQFPVYDPKLAESSSCVYIIQVNGKLRGSFDLQKNRSKEELLELAKCNPKIAKYMEGEILKVIYVPNKLLNVVVRS